MISPEVWASAISKACGHNSGRAYFSPPHSRRQKKAAHRWNKSCFQKKNINRCCTLPAKIQDMWCFKMAICQKKTTGSFSTLKLAGCSSKTTVRKKKNWVSIGYQHHYHHHHLHIKTMITVISNTSFLLNLHIFYQQHYCCHQCHNHL